MTRATVRLSVAGLAIELEAASALRHALTSPAFAGFLNEGGEPSVVLRASPLPLATVMPQGVPQARLDGRRLTVVQGEIFRLELECEAAFTHGQLFYAPTLDEVPNSPGPPLHFQSALKTACACVLAWRGGLLLHASAVELATGAALFVGQSGAGKSSMAGLFPPAAVLNDELIGVSELGRGWWAHATPFSGTLDAPRRCRSVSLAHGFALRHASRFAARPMSAAAALRLILRCTAMPQGVDWLEQQAFVAALRLRASVPWSTLSFSLAAARTVPAVRRVVEAESLRPVAAAASELLSAPRLR